MNGIAEVDFERIGSPTVDEFPAPLRTGGRFIRALFHVKQVCRAAGQERTSETYSVGYWWAPPGSTKDGRWVDTWPVSILDATPYHGTGQVIVGWLRLPDPLFDPQSDDEAKYLKGERDAG